MSCSRAAGLARQLITLLAITTVGGACSVETADDALTDVASDLNLRGATIDRSLPDVDALAYEVTLSIDDKVHEETYSASVRSTFVATSDLTDLALDYEGDAIDSVTVGRKVADYRREGDKLRIVLPTSVASGTMFTVTSVVHGRVVQADGRNPNDFAAFGGLMVRQKNAEGQKIFTSLNWPSKARRWLPLRDHPSDGAIFTAKLTFPETYTVLSNGKSKSVGESVDGKKTWRFATDAAIPPYDFHVSAYDHWSTSASHSRSNVPMTTYTYAKDSAQVSAVYGDIVNVIDFYERTFGSYRWGALRYVEEPIFGGGMEHVGVISMDETLFSDRAEARRTAFHELGHHWSGNLVRIRTWNDFWLSEGMTEYVTARAVADRDGKEEGKRQLRQYLSRALAADRAQPHAVRPQGGEVDVLTIFDAISYQKGALVLRAIEGIAGEEALSRFLRGWFDRHAFQAVTTADLELELSKELGVDLSTFFAGFVYGTHHPEVRVSIEAGKTLVVEQLQERGPADGFVFPLVVELVSAANERTRVTVPVKGKRTVISLSAAPQTLVVDPDEYLLGTVACATGTPRCKSGFRCDGSRVPMCVPE